MISLFFLKNVPSAIRYGFPVAARLKLIEIVFKPTEKKTKSERVTTPGYKTVLRERLSKIRDQSIFETVYFSLSK